MLDACTSNTIYAGRHPHSPAQPFNNTDIGMIERAEGWHGVGDGLGRERVNTIDVARGLLVVLTPQLEHDDGCRRQH